MVGLMQTRGSINREQGWGAARDKETGRRRRWWWWPGLEGEPSKQASSSGQSRLGFCTGRAGSSGRPSQRLGGRTAGVGEEET